MFSALKKLARSGDERCSAPVPMSSSLQKKFSRGVHFNMKILIKGDRNVGKSCLLQRLQGGPFIEEYAPTDQIQVAPINWAYKNSDYIVKVEVWEVVDKGRTKKKPPLGLKLENQAAPAAEEAYETPVLDATFLDVYKNASGVILMLDITKPWTFEYVVKELSSVPADLPVVVLGNHCDMQHHRQVHMHHIDQALHHARVTRTAPVRYAESSMRNGFGLRLLHKFLSVPFLRLQRTSLLEQLQRNQKDTEEIERELDDFQSSEESHYDTFVDRLASKRRQSSLAEPRAASERSPSIVLGAGKPIIPHGVNPLLAQSLNPTPKPPSTSSVETPQQIQFVSPELTRVKHTVSVEMTPPRMPQDSAPSTPSCANASGASGALDEFYAGTLDSSFLEDLAPVTHNQDYVYDSDSDEETTNPKVNVYQDDLDIEASPPARSATSSSSTFPDRHTNTAINPEIDEEDLNNMMGRSQISKDSISVNTELTQDETGSHISTLDSNHNLEMSLDNDFPLWAGDSSARRSPEGGEDPDFSREADEKVINKISEKKHKKKKSKDKDKGDYSASEKSDRKEKKNKHKKSKNEKRPSHPQQDLLAPTPAVEFNYEEYDSI